jgi:hypothetical protein
MTDNEALRRMVREVLREVLPREDLDAGPAHDVPRDKDDVRRVLVRDDHDLADLVTQVLNLAEDPTAVADLRAGRLRFVLADDDRAPDAAPDEPLDVERGAVTERLVQRAAREQRSLRVGPGAVITPLARDRARALGVTIHRTARGETR